ncbi:MAG: 16S rRNA (cytidine1402-2'-O)-methyltransferase [Planctomycetota bacterium]
MEFTVSNQSGLLYVVATPIGNLEDITERGRRILAEVDLIAAEDTRHSKKLLAHLGISTPMCAYHDHNEHKAASGIIELLKKGRNIALISDAGTPLIHDPGYQLIKLAHEHDIKLVPVPGACAAITALSVAGIATDRFIFEGFLPEKQMARRKRLQELASETRTLVFYEAPHRIRVFMQDCESAFGRDRQACIGRELSKYYETIKNDTLESLNLWLQNDESQLKGEFVVVVQGDIDAPGHDEEDAIRILKILLKASSVKQASTLAAEITGLKKNDLYKLALALQDKVKSKK